MMREQIQQIINRLQEAAQKLNQSNNLMHETLHGIADDLESAIRPQWHPMDQPPTHCREVFVLYSDGEVDIGRYDDGWRCDPPDWCGNGTIQWCEIDWPEPPEASAQ